jgi:hypothetical protein
MPSAEDIFATFPEFADAEGKDTYLELAEAEQADLWGDVRYQYAIALRAAHMMEVAGLGTSGTAGATGGVTSKRIGSLSVSYASPSTSSSGVGTLNDTRYGRLLDELIAGAVVPMMISDGCGGYGMDWGWSTSTGIWSGLRGWAWW